MRRRKRFLLVLAGAVAAFLIFLALFVAYLPDVSDLRRRDPRSTALMQLRLEQARERNVPLDIRQRWVPFEEIPELVKNTVRITEDASFYQHQGIDYEELKESIKRDLKEKKLARGGSTITQQLAKNLYLSTEKNFARKAVELLITRRLEKALTKDRIFEIYLNIIELGPGIFGVGEAAGHYFDAGLDELSLEQVVRLAAVIPRPLTTDPTGDVPWLRWKCRWILDKLLRYQYISVEEHKEAIQKFAPH